MLTRNSVSLTDGLSTSPVMSSGSIVSRSSSVQQTASSGPATLVYNCTVAFSISGSLIITASNTTQVIVKGEIQLESISLSLLTFQHTGPSLPAAPVIQPASVTSPTSAVIQWSVPVVTYSPELYTVYYTTNSSGCPTNSDEAYNKSVTVYGLNHTDFFTIRDQQYNVTLNNLDPYTVYCYKVVATNTQGRNESLSGTFQSREYMLCELCRVWFIFYQQIVKMVVFVSLVDKVRLRAELKCVLTTSGEQCVMISGMCLMLEWSADN